MNEQSGNAGSGITLPRSSELRAAQARLLYEQSRPAIISALFSTFIAAFALREQIPPMWLLAWLAVYVAFQAPRYYLVRVFPSKYQSDEEIIAWGRKFSAVTLLTHLVWGSFAIIAFPANSPAHQMILVIILGGFAAAEAVVFAPQRESFAPGIIALLAPLSVRYFYEGGETNILVGCCVIIFTVVLVLVGRQLNRGAIRNLALQLDKNRLIQSLAEAKKVTEQLNEELVAEIEERKRTEVALRASEEEIRNSLKDKEVLLREVHHRVKNNLAVMSSLLRLQSRYAKDGLYREVFDDAQDRIRSMALAHEKLYESGNVGELNIKRYINSLIGHLVDSIGKLGSPVQLEKEIDDIPFGIETAVPLGFIVTELVTNCLKHAFPGNREGRIWVSLHRTDVTAFELIVRDDGVGLPEGLDLDAPQSFGLDLAGILARQLRGRIEIKRGGGTEVRLTFSSLGK